MAIPTTPEQADALVPESPGALERVTQRLESPAAAETSVEPKIEVPPMSTVGVAAPTPVARPIVIEKSPLREDIEAALADEQLQRIYAGLPPAVQGRFRDEGSKLAVWIETAITAGKLILKELHHRIVAWLRIIPRVNHWYLQQEAKVKTDAILALRARTQ